jgi:hypothetical protein
MFNYQNYHNKALEILNKKMAAASKRLEQTVVRASLAKNPRKEVSILVEGITTIPYSDSVLKNVFLCSCKCGHKWKSLPEDFKFSRLNMLIVYCPECAQPGLEYSSLPTLRTLSVRLK